MLKKTLLLATGLLFAMAGTAHAQQSPPAGCYPTCADRAAVTDISVVPGGPITINVQTFRNSVTFTMFSAPVVLGTATANAEGVATLTATIPSGTATGTHTIEATGMGADGQPLMVSTKIEVMAAGGTGAANLPTTGSSSTTPMTQVAVAAIAGGGLLVLLANKRRTTKAARETADV
ncbi:MAG: LPXTG cell wall anchor domain-containing protein [Acidimicrobiales bacterium]